MDKFKVLIVEDERITSEDIKTTLEKYNYEICGIVSTGEDAIKKAGETRPDIIIMDILLSGDIDGIDAANEIRSRFQIPVVYLSAYADEKILERARVSEAYGYILKPFQDRELHSNIEMAIHKNRLERKIEHINSVLKAIRDVNQYIVVEKEQEVLINRVCDSLIINRGYNSAWFAIIDNSSKIKTVFQSGIGESFDEFKKLVLKGDFPDCIDEITKSNELIIYRPNDARCLMCPMLDYRADKGTMLSKIFYRNKLFGYLCVSLPSEIVADEEEKALLLEVSKDLGLALNNIEFEKKQKEAEEALKESEERYRTLVDNQSEGLVIADEFENFVFVNPAANELFGVAPDTLVGRNFKEFVNKETLNLIKKETLSRKKGVRNFYEVVIKRPDGEKSVLSISASPNFKDGKFSGSVGIIRNITKQQLAEKALIESEEKFHTLYNTMTEGVALHEVIYDKSGKPVDYRITDCNESYTLLTGIPREKAIGQIASALYNTETAPYLDIYSGVVQSGNSTNFEVYFEPMKKHFNISVVSLGSERFATVFKDMTQRINYEQELQSSKEKAEEMNRLKTNFLANMSHELRTPMVAILGFSEMLSTYDKDSDVQEMSSMIYNGSKRLMGTLNMILDLTRLESDKMEINKSNVDLKKLIIEEINLYTPIASKNSLYLKQDIENERFMFLSDEKTLRSIIDNLINNAIKFTYKGGVTINLRYIINNKKEKEYIEIRIIDTGIGISEKSRNMIFEEFRQVSEGLNRRFEGAGLGLTITKRFVDLLGGKIDFESEIGKGTTFIVQFPVKEKKINILKEINKDFEKQKSIKPANMKKSAKHKILFVDDDETSLKLVELLLKNVCDVEFASEGMEAINKSKDNDYDAILMDINLGRGIDGVTAAKEIRKTEKYIKKPIVALTAFAMKGDKEEFLNAGFTHYISKPFTKQNLLDLMKKILD